MKKIKRKWGWYVVLAQGDRYKIKKMFVSAGKKTSLQKHQLRSEVWIPIAGGEVKVTEKGAWHQLANLTDTGVYYIEVQIGKCIERDIIRHKEL